MQELVQGTKQALDNLSIYKASATDEIRFEDVDEMTLAMEHFDDLRAEQGYQTVWSMYDLGCKPLDWHIFTDKPRIVTYKCIKNLSNSGHGVEWETFTCMAKDGTIGGLWAAAESCFKQAQLALGDWHIYIEDFTVLDDGNLELVTGS